jgi:hypothetical protein
MNELIAKLYDQALVLESNGDYVAGELDPVKFAELIVRECSNVAHKCILEDGSDFPMKSVAYRIKEHFGVEE